MRIGILLAAGRARRMGQTKQLLDWPAREGPAREGPAQEGPVQDEPRPLVAAAYDAVAWACDTMVVVLGHEATPVEQALGSRPHETVLVDPNAPMYTSLRAGMLAAQRISLEASFLVHPADHPEVPRATLDKLLRQADANSNRAVMPEYAGRGGHPVFIPARFASRLLRYEGHGGLRQYWADHPDDCLRLPVDDPAITLDIDTPDDYRRALGNLSRRR